MPRPSKVPKQLQPMLATLIDAPFDSRDWVFESKWDGFRLIAKIEKRHVTLYSRSGLIVSDNYKPIAKALEKVKQDAVIDGEPVALDAHGVSRFQLLQNALRTSANLHYCVFDIMFLDGEDLRGLPLVERKKRLQSILPKDPLLTYSEHWPEHGKRLFKEAQKLGPRIVPFWQRAPERLRVLRILSSWLLLALPVGALFLQLASGSSGAADKKPDECGLASVYSGVSEETASGEDTRSEDATAAHRTLPFGTKVLVSNQKNGQSAVVRITDRGPFVDGRIIDVSQIAARKLGFSGLTKVCLKILEITENGLVGKPGVNPDRALRQPRPLLAPPEDKKRVRSNPSDEVSSGSNGRSPQHNGDFVPQTIVSICIKPAAPSRRACVRQSRS